MAESSNSPYVILMGIDGKDVSVYAFDCQVKQQLQSAQVDAKIAAMEAKFMEKMKAKEIEGEFLRIDNDKPGQAIVECALEREVTFVVIGTRNQGKVRRTLMGSISDYIVHNCHVPVLLCKHKSGWEKEFKQKEKKEKKEAAKREKIQKMISEAQPGVVNN